MCEKAAQLLCRCIAVNGQTQKKNDLILTERHSDLRSKVKDLTSTNKSYAITLLFDLLLRFIQIIRVVRNESDIKNINQRKAKGSTKPTKEFWIEEIEFSFWMCSDARIHSNTAATKSTLTSTISFVLLNDD